MGIYIPGMEMPKCCEDCPIANCKHDIGYTYSGRRSMYCPLVTVPPHGRLIDASEKISVQMYDEEHEEWPIVDMTIDDLLCQGWIEAEALTIIPAEEGE